MCIELLEIQLASDEEYQRPHGVDVGTAAGFPFRGLEQSIERIDEANGLSGLNSGSDAIKVTVDHFGDLFHRFDFGAHDIAAPLLQHGSNDIELLAFEDMPRHVLRYRIQHLRQKQ